MGLGYIRTCPKCGFEYQFSTGVGLMFPKVYAETVQKAKSGELGKELQEFFKEHEDGAINAECVNLCCGNCGHLTNDMDLTMYVPNENKPEKLEHSRWTVFMSFEDTEFVDKSDLEEFYTEHAKYPHKCEKCGGNMKVLSEDSEMMCPECKVPLEITNHFCWD